MPDAMTTESEITLGCFEVGGRLIAIDVANVREVVRWQPRTDAVAFSHRTTNEEPGYQVAIFCVNDRAVSACFRTRTLDPQRRYCLVRISDIDTPRRAVLPPMRG